MVMSIAKVIEVVGKSGKSWEDAAQRAIKDVSKTIRNVKCLEVVGQTANVENGKIKEYKTDLKVLFVVEK